MNELTHEQRTQIKEYIIQTAWVHINDTLLTKEQQDDKEKMRAIAFEMEEIFKSVAAEFGLCGMA